MLPPFPQNPRTLTVRQLECVRCREVFTIAEDSPSRSVPRTNFWQVPQDQYSLTPLRYVKDREQVGVVPEVRSQPIEHISANQDWGQNYHLNCPRCGADNRNWLFVSSRLQPKLAPSNIRGSIISAILFILVLAKLWTELIVEGRFFAMVCLFLAAALPLLIVPGQWRKLRDGQLAQRFLPQLPQPKVTPPLYAVAILYLVFIVGFPSFRYVVKPVFSQTIATTVAAMSETESNNAKSTEENVADELEFFFDWFYLGTIVSLVSSVFAVMGVNEVVKRVNNQLPRPIYANSATMVRVTLWEAKRALEIKDFFDRIQWTMTRRNEQGGIDMEGYFRDPPEFLANGQLDDFVRVQKYEISTDRWCVITSAKILDTKHPRPAGGMYSMPLPNKASDSEVVLGRIKY